MKLGAHEVDVVACEVGHPGVVAVAPLNPLADRVPEVGHRLLEHGEGVAVVVAQPLRVVQADHRHRLMQEGVGREPAVRFLVKADRPPPGGGGVLAFELLDEPAHLVRLGEVLPGAGAETVVGHDPLKVEHGAFEVVGADPRPGAHEQQLILQPCELRDGHRGAEASYGCVEAPVVPVLERVERADEVFGRGLTPGGRGAYLVEQCLEPLTQRCLRLGFARRMVPLDAVGVDAVRRERILPHVPREQRHRLEQAAGDDVRGDGLRLGEGLRRPPAVARAVPHPAAQRVPRCLAGGVVRHCCAERLHAVHELPATLDLGVLRNIGVRELFQAERRAAEFRARAAHETGDGPHARERLLRLVAGGAELRLLAGRVGPNFRHLRLGGRRRSAGVGGVLLRNAHGDRSARDCQNDEGDGGGEAGGGVACEEAQRPLPRAVAVGTH